MMTLEQFNEIPAGNVFDKGEAFNEPEGLYMSSNKVGDKLRWVAVKGYANDWCVYVQWATNSFEFIEKQGDKITRTEHIQRCVPCEPEVLRRYRF